MSSETTAATIQTEQASEAASEHTQGRLTNEGSMDRLTARLPDEMHQCIDRLVESGRFANKTEAVRHAIREQFMDDPRPARSLRGEGR